MSNIPFTDVTLLAMCVTYVAHVAYYLVVTTCIYGQQVNVYIISLINRSKSMWIWITHWYT